MKYLHVRKNLWEVKQECLRSGNISLVQNLDSPVTKLTGCGRENC
jgi:hypothetical protein